MSIDRVTFEELERLPVEEVREKLQGKYFVFHNFGQNERDDQHDYYVILRYDKEGFKSSLAFPLGKFDNSPINSEYDVNRTPRSFVRELLREGIMEVYSSARVPENLKFLWGLDKGEHDFSDDYNYDEQTPASFDNDVLEGDKSDEARRLGYDLSFELRKHGIEYHSL